MFGSISYFRKKVVPEKSVKQLRFPSESVVRGPLLYRVKPGVPIGAKTEEDHEESKPI